MQRIRPTLLLPLAALAGCASVSGSPSGDVAIETDGRGLFVAAGRETASVAGVLIAQHEAAEEARSFCEGHQRHVLLLGPVIDDDAASGKVTVLVRFRCAGAEAAGQARP